MSPILTDTGGDKTEPPVSDGALAKLIIAAILFIVLLIAVVVVFFISLVYKE